MNVEKIALILGSDKAREYADARAANIQACRDAVEAANRGKVALDTLQAIETEARKSLFGDGGESEVRDLLNQMPELPRPTMPASLASLLGIR